MNNQSMAELTEVELASIAGGFSWMDCLLTPFLNKKRRR